jgi:hypothetical protein
MKCVTTLFSSTKDFVVSWEFDQVQTAGDDSYVLFTDGGKFYQGRPRYFLPSLR